MKGKKMKARYLRRLTIKRFMSLSYKTVGTLRQCVRYEEALIKGKIVKYYE